MSDSSVPEILLDSSSRSPSFYGIEMGGESPFRRVCLTWLLFVAGIGLFLIGLYRLAPIILENDRDTSVWYLNLKAEELWREAESIGRWEDPQKRKNLLTQVVACLRKACQLEPESRHHRWFLTWSLYSLANVEYPPDPALVAEAVCMAQESWEHTRHTWERPALFLANYYLKTGQEELAKPFLEFLIKQPSPAPEVYDGMLKIARDENNPTLALQLLKEKGERYLLTPAEREQIASLEDSP